MGTRIPQSTIDEVVSRARIVEIVGEYVQLKRQGTRYVGLCPFHGERTPSFHVNAERNFYHCFGCGASGNTISFLMEHDGLSFPEAVRKLADRVGVVIPESGVSEERQRENRAERDKILDALDLARRFYLAHLKSGRSPQAQEYLSSRGVDAATAEAFEIGWAPESWSAMTDALMRRGVSGPTLEKAGLSIPRKGGDGWYDRFRQRVMFPIVSLSSRVLGFSGRTLDPEERAKYVNSPETPVYTKGNELFGLQLAHRAIREQGAAILVEGNFDVVALRARGLQNVCAPLGTALTPHQARLLQRYTDRVILLFDGDNAGRAAADKALQVLLSSDIRDVLLVDLPAGSDPDDLVRTEGIDALKARIDAARPMLELRLDEAIRPAAGRGDMGAKQRAIETVCQLLAPLSDTMIRRGFVEDAARRLEVDPAALWERASKTTVSSEPLPPPSVMETPDFEMPALRALDSYEAMLVELLAASHDFLTSFAHQELYHVIEHPELAHFLEEVAIGWLDGGGPDFRAAVNQLEDGRLHAMLTAAMVRDRGITEETLPALFEETTRSLTVRWVRRELQRISEAMRTATPEEEVYLMERASALTRTLDSLTKEAA